MLKISSQNILRYTAIIIILDILVWTVLFFRNPLLKDALVDIHLIFISTTLSYYIIRRLLPKELLELFKIFIRTLFRVWIFIFITVALSKSMEKIGFLLSITYILGYMEGLLDLDKWLDTKHNLPWLLQEESNMSSHHKACGSIFLMGCIHFLCAWLIWSLYLLW